MKLTHNQPIVKSNQSIFKCKAPVHENITSYIWKLNNKPVSNGNKEQYKFTPNCTRNGTKLSCAAITAAGVTSNESQVILQAFCK